MKGLTQSLLVDGRAAGLKALGGGGLKEQRDAEGYFQHRVGEKLRGRYKVRVCVCVCVYVKVSFFYFLRL